MDNRIKYLYTFILGIVIFNYLSFEKLSSKDSELNVNNLVNNSVLNMLKQDMWDKCLDTIYFKLPFDLHSNDCGTPDCYITYLSFSLKISDNLKMPKTLIVNISEEGCIEEKVVNKHVEFSLFEQNNKFVNYYSENESSTLIISKKAILSNFIYYFPDFDGSNLKFNELENLLLNHKNDSVNVETYQISRIRK